MVIRIRTYNDPILLTTFYFNWGEEYRRSFYGDFFSILGLVISRYTGFVRFPVVLTDFH